MHDTSAFYNRYFQDNYPALKRWALQITSNDRALAEDLLHDVYLRVSQRADQPVGSIDSVSAYLYKALRNGFISHLRWRTRRGGHQSLTIDDEAIAISLMTVDPRAALRVQDELRAICAYACERKATSISASILILRFIHGYYSAEVARVINRSRNAVEVRLTRARLEVDQHLFGPPDDPITGQVIRTKNVVRGAELLDELRSIVFNSVDGRCLTPEKRRRSYRASRDGLDREELSHLVSCAECLDEVNKLLGIPLLAERHPLDSVGPQTLIERLENGRSRAAGV